jgi:hypothetical protein
MCNFKDTELFLAFDSKVPSKPVNWKVKEPEILKKISEIWGFGQITIKRAPYKEPKLIRV